MYVKEIQAGVRQNLTGLKKFPNANYWICGILIKVLLLQ